MLPERVVDWYKNHGYQFLGLSEHNVLPLGSRWVQKTDVAQGHRPGMREAGGEPAYDRASEMHDGGESLRLKTLPELRREFEEVGRFVLLCNEEVTNTGAGRPVHVTAVNVSRAIPSVDEATAKAAVERTLVQIVEQGKIQGYAALGVVNHPNFAWAVGASDLSTVRDARFVEIFNGHPFTASRGDAGRRSVVRVWDMANAERVLGRRWPPLFGVASDDAHVEAGSSEPSPGRGWIYVRATALRSSSLLDAMQRGDFYASTGVRLKRLDYDRRTRVLSVAVEPEPDTTYTTEFVVTKTTATPLDLDPNDRWDGPMVGVVAASISGLESRYALTEADAFVRATITASKRPENPIESDYTGDATQLKQAFTQPVGWEKYVR